LICNNGNIYYKAVTENTAITGLTAFIQVDLGEPVPEKNIRSLTPSLWLLYNIFN